MEKAKWKGAQEGKRDHVKFQIVKVELVHAFFKLVMAGKLLQYFFHQNTLKCDITIFKHHAQYIFVIS